MSERNTIGLALNAKNGLGLKLNIVDRACGALTTQLVSTVIFFSESALKVLYAELRAALVANLANESILWRESIFLFAVESFFRFTAFVIFLRFAESFEGLTATRLTRFAESLEGGLVKLIWFCWPPGRDVSGCLPRWLSGTSWAEAKLMMRIPIKNETIFLGTSFQFNYKIIQAKTPAKRNYRGQ